MLKPKVLIIIILWIAAIAISLGALMKYKGTSGRAGQAVEQWPSNSLVQISVEKPTLIMLAHPKCPCTRASIGELEVLAARAKDQFAAAVLFYEPADAPRDWTESDLVRAAGRIPGVRVVLDSNGKLTRRFGAETSGQTLIYGTNGRLIFSGGLTGARGHMGDNAGLDAALKTITTQAHATNHRTATPVFGCNLFDPCDENQTAANN